MKLFYLFITIITLTVLSACNRKDCDALKRPKPDCICPAIYDPVCGCNDVTYGNSCEAECHGIKEYKKGVCP